MQLCRRICFVAGIAFAITGCLADPELADTSAVAQAEEVIQYPYPFASCIGCSGDRVVGEPVVIQTAYRGVCSELGWEYICMEQSYSIDIDCSGPCDVFGETYGHGAATTEVRPRDPGPMTISVDIKHLPSGDPNLTFFMPPFTAHVPDGIEVTCVAGEDDEPCTDGVLPQPVALYFDLVAGDVVLTPAREFRIDSNRPGWYSEATDAWYVHASGAVEVGASYGYGVPLSVAVDLDIAVPPPQTSLRRPGIRPRSARDE